MAGAFFGPAAANGDRDAYLQFVQDLRWKAAEADLLAGAVGLIQRDAASGIAPDRSHVDDTVGSLASLFGVPSPPRRWRACVVALFAATPLGVPQACLHYIDDPDRPVTKEILLEQAKRSMLRRILHNETGLGRPS